MKESYTIEEITEMLDLKNIETVRRYIRNGKGKDFEQICNNMIKDQPADDSLMLELVNPQKRPYTVTRRSLEILIKRKFDCDDSEVNNLLTNFESLHEEEQPKGKKKHHLFGIKALPYSYNGLKRTFDKIRGKAHSKPSHSIEESNDIIENGISLSTDILAPKESAEYYRTVAILLKKIPELIEKHDKELELLNDSISQTEQELAILKKRQKDLVESKNSLIDKKRKITDLL